MNHRLLTMQEKLANRKGRHRRKYERWSVRQRESVAMQIPPSILACPEMIKPEQAFSLVCGSLKAAKSALRAVTTGLAALAMSPYVGSWSAKSASPPVRVLRRSRRGSEARAAVFVAHYEAGLRVAEQLRVLGDLPPQSNGMAYLETGIIGQLFTGIQIPRALSREVYLLNLLPNHRGPQDVGVYAKTMRPLFRLPLSRQIAQELEKSAARAALSLAASASRPGISDGFP